MNPTAVPSWALAFALAVLMTLLRLGFEIQETLQVFGTDLRALSPHQLQSLGWNLLLRPSLLAGTVFLAALLYLPLTGLNLVSKGLGRKTSDLMAGSMAQQELDRDT